MTISTHVLAALIGLIYPAYFIFTSEKRNYRLKNDEDYRLVDYKQTILIFWLVAMLIIANTFIDKEMPLNFYPTFDTLGIVLAALILFFIVLLIFTSKVETKEKAESIIQKMKDDYHYLPKSKTEFIAFNILSLSAGICEELIFRLFLFSYLFENTNLAIAFVLTNIIFALTHIGSSKQNIISAFILGLLFTVIYYFSRNIWLVVILHSTIDMNTGVLSYYANKLTKRAVDVS